MKTFVVVPRGKKYWVEEVDEDGTRKTVIAFGTEDAALRCPVISRTAQTEPPCPQLGSHRNHTDFRPKVDLLVID